MSFFPIFQTLRNYNASFFRWDLIAGITLALFVLPESMAYATLAGLPTQYGIYCCLVGALFFAFFTTTKQVAIGPTSAISLMIGSGVGAMASGDMTQYIAVASLTAFAVFVFCLLAYFLRLSSLVNFVSDTILLGFKTGAALSIATTQLPKLFGIHASGKNFFERLYNLLIELPQTHFPLLAFGILSLSFLIILSHYFPGKPVSLVLVVISILFVYIFPYLVPGLETAGEIPSGLPSFSFPSIYFKDLDEILGLAFGCFMMAYIETSSVARTFGEKNNQDPDLRQELLALGMANFSVAFAGGYPVSGGLSQSQVNAQAGAKTQVALIVCTVVLCLLLLFGTNLLADLPEEILAVLVIYAVSHLIKVKEIKRLKQLNKGEFRLAIVAIIAVLFFGILKGVIIAAFLSIIQLLVKTSKPHLAILGRIPGSNTFSDITFHADNLPVSQCLIIRPESSLLYYNQQNIFDSIRSILDQWPETKLLVLECSAIPFVDVAGSKMIVKLESQLRMTGIELKIVNALSTVRDILRKQGLEESIGKISRRATLDAVVDEFEKSAKS